MAVARTGQGKYKVCLECTMMLRCKKVLKKKKKKRLKDMSKEHRDYSKELEIIKTGLD